MLTTSPLPTTPTKDLQPWAETLLCLGQAFLPPRDPSFQHAIIHDLPRDLQDLNDTLGFTTNAALAQWSEHLGHWADDEQALLKCYSRLFLSPPTPASLNAGRHLDGQLMGPSAVEMEQVYQAHALARDPNLHQLPDHLALQLQFVAFLLAEAPTAADPETYLHDARGFTSRYLRGWLKNLVSQCQTGEAAYHLPPVYSQLADFTHQAILRLLEQLPQREAAPQPTDQAPPPVRDNPFTGKEADKNAGDTHPITCSRCSEPFMAEGELAGIIAALHANDVSAAHLCICPDCRAGAMGMTAMKPPEVR
ncbi:molecular chaperone [Ectothiorhodospira sp. BSL-9]|uniref:TorD/DmsD family molecular chaperone n=1 Tax=Ectothiorhodospira sp. BSL-9 TaxID=1442136 RepID=UPI000B1282F8|nr:molecular chaperone TorD family protein [Ectothiorhodospira sp. BSL-9]